MGQSFIINATSNATIQEFIRTHFESPPRGVRLALREAAHALTEANPQLADPRRISAGDQILIPRDFALAPKPGARRGSKCQTDEVRTARSLLAGAEIAEQVRARRAMSELDETMRLFDRERDRLAASDFAAEAATLPDRVEQQRRAIEASAGQRMRTLRHLQESLDEFATFLESGA